MLLGYSDSELANMGGYDLVHYDDLAYVASAHQERKFITSALIYMWFQNVLRHCPITLFLSFRLCSGCSVIWAYTTE